jgi:acyl carrier protein
MPTITAENTGKELRQFIVDNFLFGRDRAFSDEDSLIENGLIDSTGVLELIAFLEEKYAIRIEQGEMIPDNLDSIRNLSDFVRWKRQGPA